jgi:hypothetical protein
VLQNMREWRVAALSLRSNSLPHPVHSIVTRLSRERR